MGFREIDTEEALAQAGLTFVEYGPGEAVPWEAGLYLLDVETGEVEGWIIPEGDAVEETDRGRVAVGTVTVNVGLSPGNRFLLLTSDGLHDRLTGRTYTWNAGRLWPVLANYGADLVGWVLPDGERLIFRSQANGAYLVVNSSLSLLAEFQLRAGRGERLWPDAAGRYVFAQTPDDLYLFDLWQAGAAPLAPTASWSLSWFEGEDRKGNPTGWVESFDRGIVLINMIDPDTCRIVRYSADSSAPTDHAVPCWQDYSPFFDLSPDGSLIAIATSGSPAGHLLAPTVTVVSIFDVASGEELLRIHGAHQPWFQWDITDLWLADSSALVVGTAYGEQVVSIDGRWATPPPGIPAPDDAGRFATAEASVTDRQGVVLASLEFGPSSRPILGLGATLVTWGSTSRELRVDNGIFYEGYNVLSPARPPVIERPPFSDRLLVEAVAEPCAQLHEGAHVEDAPVTCLPTGSRAEVVHYSILNPVWMLLRTDDGLEGWAKTEHLRWAGNVAPLE